MSDATKTMLAFSVCGGLLGYGIYGTFQNFCYGAGIGLVVVFVMLILAGADG